jgi:hypothetical protein
MKFISCFLIGTIALCSCHSEYKGLNTDVLSQDCAADKGIIISCTRCSCIKEDLKDYLVKGKDAKNITIYSDSNCVRGITQAKTNHIEQSSIDSIYESNYNLMLYKKQNSSIKFKLIKTEESKDLLQIADSFFK